jgi:tetratricopeptide (TPR) repeat protein
LALGTFVFCTASPVSAGADPLAASVPAVAEANPVVHITDAQDRFMEAKLKPAAEARSRGDALYAQATLLSEGLASEQQQAVGLFRQVVALDPSFVDAQIKLANLLLQFGQFDPALKQLQSAAVYHPNSVPIEVALGYTERLRGQNEDAIRYCRKALAADSSQVLAMRVMLEIASDQDDLAGGVLHIEDILKSSADIPAASWLGLARLYEEIARSERFPPGEDVILKTRLPILQQAVAKAAPNVETLALLADTYHKLGRNREALKAYRKAAEQEPDSVDIVLNCAEIETDLGDVVGAIKDYEAADDLSPGLPGLRERLSDLYIDQGIAFEVAHHPEKAEEAFQHVFQSADCPPDAYLKLALFQLGQKEIKQAGVTLAAAEIHFPQSARVRLYQAMQHRYEKDIPAALASLDQVRALAVGPEASVVDADFYRESALTLNLAGQKDQLEALLREALGRYPDNPEWMNELAYYWADQGTHLPEALALGQRAAALNPKDGPILDTCGWIYFQMGQPKDALPYLQRAAVMTNNDPVVLQHVGDTYLKLGLRREAIATWTLALEKDPKNGALANRIDAAQAQAKNAHLRSAPTP